MLWLRFYRLDGIPLKQTVAAGKLSMVTLEHIFVDLNDLVYEFQLLYTYNKGSAIDGFGRELGGDCQSAAAIFHPRTTLEAQPEGYMEKTNQSIPILSMREMLVMTQTTPLRLNGRDIPHLLGAE